MPKATSTAGAESTSSRSARIPRPPNAFICFRSHFYAQLRTVTQPDDNKALHQTLLSTSAGLVWREMTRDEKAPFVKRAEEEKKAHGEMYPEYQYMPRRKAKAMGEGKGKGKGKATRKQLRSSSSHDGGDSIAESSTMAKDIIPIPRYPDAAAIYKDPSLFRHGLSQAAQAASIVDSTHGDETSALEPSSSFSHPLYLCPAPPPQLQGWQPSTPNFAPIENSLDCNSLFHSEPAPEHFGLDLYLYSPSYGASESAESAFVHDMAVAGFDFASPFESGSASESQSTIEQEFDFSSNLANGFEFGLESRLRHSLLSWT